MATTVHRAFEFRAECKPRWLNATCLVSTELGKSFDAISFVKLISMSLKDILSTLLNSLIRYQCTLIYLEYTVQPIALHQICAYSGSSTILLYTENILSTMIKVRHNILHCTQVYAK